MNTVLIKVAKTLAYIFVFSAISFTIVYLLNKSTLDLAQSEVKVVTPDNYSAIKDEIAEGSVIEIKGTPDLLMQVSEEDKDAGQGVQYYYTALKEYGDEIVVKIKPGKLDPLLQTFKGRVVNLSSSSQGSRIISALNKPIDFNEDSNEETGKNLDQQSKGLIESDSEGNFNDSTLLVLDEELPNTRQVVLGIALWTSVLSLFLITLFRKKVFLMR